jgi:hypothetical protein
MSLILNIENNFDLRRRLHYFWDNIKLVGIRVLARLYSFYIPKNSDRQHKAFIEQYLIMGDCCILDHSLVLFSYNLGEWQMVVKGYFKMSLRP